MKLYSILDTQKLATRDGGTGKYASVYLPGYGRWNANGVTYAYPSSELAQSGGLLIGRTKPNTFRKDCCDCNTAL